jgi:hypothetical protein
VAKTFIFIEEFLQSQGIEFEAGYGIVGSYLKFHKGQANVNILIGNEMNRWMKDELKERVRHGEGLIIICNKPAQDPEFAEFTGVTVKPIPGKQRETAVQILPTEFSSAGGIELTEKAQLGIQKEQSDVIIIAITQQHQYPVMAYRPYGQGNVLVVAIPLAFDSGAERAAQLLVNAINKFSKDIYTHSPMTRILPIEISITNETSADKAITVKQNLPYGVEGFAYKPEPSEPEPGSGDELQWKLTVPASSSESISFWLKLPDQVNTFDMKTGLYESGTLLAEGIFTREVTYTVLAYLDELLLELAALPDSGSDTRFIRKAREHLELLRSRSGDYLMVHLLNLQDAVQAASSLGEVKNIDVSSQRYKTQEIMIIMGRRLYEKVITWGEHLLAPYLK